MWQPTYPTVIVMMVLGFAIMLFSLNRQKKIIATADRRLAGTDRMIDRWWGVLALGFLILIFGIMGSFGLAGQSDRDRLDAQCKPRGMEGVQRGMFSRGLCRDPKTGQLYQFEDVR